MIFDFIQETEDFYQEIINNLRVIKVIYFDEFQITYEGKRSPCH